MDFFQHFQSWNSPFLGLSSRHQGIPLLILSEGYVPISIAEDFEGPPMLVHTQINLKVGRLTKTALNLATPSFSIWESTSSLVIYAWWSPTNFLVWMRNSSSLSFGSWPVLKAALWNRIGGGIGLRICTYFRNDANLGGAKSGSFPAQTHKQQTTDEKLQPEPPRKPEATFIRLALLAPITTNRLKDKVSCQWARHIHSLTPVFWSCFRDFPISPIWMVRIRIPTR